MIQPQSRPLAHQLRSKTGGNLLETAATTHQRELSGHSFRSSSEPTQPMDLSGQSTEALIRRVLCPLSRGGLSEIRPLDQLLPPLTSSNEVDLQLYAIVAIVMRDFVYSWYAKITPDQSFVEEVIRIVAHCTRDLEQRLRRIDLELLLLHEIPDLVVSHINGKQSLYTLTVA
jgi:hypothetical protein